MGWQVLSPFRGYANHQFTGGYDSDGFSAAQIRRDDADIIGAFRIEHPKVVQSQRRFPMPAVSVLEIAVKGTVVAGIGVDQCPDASLR